MPTAWPGAGMARAAPGITACLFVSTEKVAYATIFGEIIIIIFCSYSSTFKWEN